MRILIISAYFPPENSSASLRPYTWAKYWTKIGNQVSVLTTVKDRDKPEAMHVDNNGFQVNEINYSSFFYSIKAYYKREKKVLSPLDSRKWVENLTPVKYVIPGKKSVLAKINDWRKSRGLSITARMPDQTDLWIKPATEWAKNNGPWDLVISTYGPYSCHLVALNLREENLCKHWIVDFRDLWTDNPIYKGVYPLTLFEKYLERKIIANADFITTVSEPLAQTLRKKYSQAKVEVIENGFDTEEFNDLEEETIFRDNKVRIIHTGTVYKGKMNPGLLFEAIASISNDITLAPLLTNLEVIFLGSDNTHNMAQAEEMNVAEWVKDGGFLPRKQILRMQHEAHALLFLGFDKGKTPGILSGKLYEYMFSETPVWAVDVDSMSAVGQIIQQANAGILLGEDLNLLKEMLINLLKDPVKQKSSLNTTYLQRFERSHLAYKMLALVNN